MALLLATAATAAATPAISVAGAVLPPGTNTTISGTGFAPNALVDIYLDGVQVDFSKADPSGAFPTNRVRIPADSAPGPHHLTARSSNSSSGATKVITVGTQWTQAGFGAGGRAFNPYENLVGPGNVGNLEHAWSTPAGDDVHGAPIVYAGMLFYATDSELRAVRLSDHALRWHKTTLGLQNGGAPVAANGNVYIGAGGGFQTSARLYAFNFATGAEVWHATFPAGTDFTNALGPPVVSQGVVYVQVRGEDGTGGGLFAVPTSCSNPCTPLWHSASTLGGLPSPAVGGDHVFVRNGNGVLEAYRVGCATGNGACSPEWTSLENVGGFQGGAPVYSAGRVYVNEPNGTVHAYQSDLCFGTTQCSNDWSTVPLTSGIDAENRANLAVAEGRIYEVGGDGILNAFSTTCDAFTDCPVYWSRKVGRDGGTLTASAMVAHGVVYAQAGRFVMAMDAKCDGSFLGCQPLWHGAMRLPAGIFSYLSLSDGVLYVPGDRVRAFDLPSAGAR